MFVRCVIVAVLTPSGLMMSSAKMTTITRVVICICMSITLCNVGCEDSQGQKSSDTDANNALVAMETDMVDDDDALVEGMYTVYRCREPDS